MCKNILKYNILAPTFNNDIACSINNVCNRLKCNIQILADRRLNKHTFRCSKTQLSQKWYNLFIQGQTNNYKVDIGISSKKILLLKILLYIY